jgi:hypothetical protein
MFAARIAGKPTLYLQSARFSRPWPRFLAPSLSPSTTGAPCLFHGTSHVSKKKSDRKKKYISSDLISMSLTNPESNKHTTGTEKKASGEEITTEDDLKEVRTTMNRI